MTEKISEKEMAEYGKGLLKEEERIYVESWQEFTSVESLIEQTRTG